MARLGGPDAPDSRNALENVGGSRSRSRGWTSLRGEPLDPPSGTGLAPVPEPIVEAVRAPFPELNPFGPERVSTPVLGQRNITRLPGVELRHTSLEHVPRGAHAALPRVLRRQLSTARA